MQINYPLISYITAFVGTIICFSIAILLLRRKDKIKGTGYLIAWIVVLGLSILLGGAAIIALQDPKLVLIAYQIAVLTAVSCVFIYRFVEVYYQIKPIRLLNYLAYIYLIIVTILELFARNLLVSEVIFDPEVNYFKAIFGVGTNYVGYFGMLLWILAIIRLLRIFKRTKSAIERNRLKYLLMGITIPLIGVILITFPIEAIRRYPSDMFATAIGFIFIGYGILKYRLMDITLIISRGLVYTIISSLIAGIYVFTFFLFSNVIGLHNENQPFVAVLFTAFVVALIIQPLQSTTQRFVDKVFGFNEENMQIIVKYFTDKMTKAIRNEMVTDTLFDVIATSFTPKLKILFLKQVNSNKYELIKQDTNQTTPDFSNLYKSFPNINWEENIVIAPTDYYDQNLKTECEKLGIELLINLTTHTNTVGVLGLGEKKSERSYSLSDYQTLEIIANQTSITMENISHFEKERELDKAKSDFINIASHNLRTPLTSIIGNIELIQDSSITKNSDVFKNFQNLSSSAHQLASLVEQLITVSSVEGETVNLNKTLCSMQLELQEICDELNLKALAKGIRVKTDIKDVGNVFIDRIKIKLVVYSLIENAIKFTEKGEVTVSLKLENQKIYIIVNDTGIGIPTDEMPHLFEKFYQIHSRFEPMVGVGLGLYLSKVIISAHGGLINVSSTLGKGSQFTIELPNQNT